MLPIAFETRREMPRLLESHGIEPLSEATSILYVIVIYLSLAFNLFLDIGLKMILAGMKHL